MLNVSVNVYPSLIMVMQVCVCVCVCVRACDCMHACVCTPYAGGHYRNKQFNSPRFSSFTHFIAKYAMELLFPIPGRAEIFKCWLIFMSLIKYYEII